MNDNTQNAVEISDAAIPNENERTFGMLAHLLGIFTGFLGPLIIWLVKKDEMPFVDDQGKEAVNFQITIILASIALFIILGVFSAVIPILAILVIFLWFVVWIGTLVLLIMATVAANKGQRYRYPVCLRLIK